MSGEETVTRILSLDIDSRYKDVIESIRPEASNMLIIM